MFSLPNLLESLHRGTGAGAEWTESGTFQLTNVVPSGVCYVTLIL